MGTAVAPEVAPVMVSLLAVRVAVAVTLLVVPVVIAVVPAVEGASTRVTSDGVTLKPGTPGVTTRAEVLVKVNSAAI